MQLYAYGKKLSVSETASINTTKDLIACTSDSAIITPELMHEIVSISVALTPAVGSANSPALKQSATSNSGSGFAMGLAVGLII